MKPSGLLRPVRISFLVMVTVLAARTRPLTSRKRSKPELGIAEREIKKVKNGRFVLLPISDLTRGHGTHTSAAAWQQYLDELLKGSAR